MKRIVLCMIVAVATLAAAQGITGATSTDLASPAAQSIAAASKAISDKPTEYAGYNLLATALVRRAQETSDVSFYTQAEGAVKKSLEIAPHNFDAEKIQVSILLGEHEDPAALEAAKTLNKRVPDDVMVYGLLTDANVELGNYRDAEDSAQWMLNLRPANRPALTRAAHLRELFGDVEGAYEFMELAYQSTPATESGERAWTLTQMGHLRLASGSADAAEKLFPQALTSFPSYPAALGNLAQVRITQKRYAEAVVLLQQCHQAAPRAENLYDLAEALQLAALHRIIYRKRCRGTRSDRNMRGLCWLRSPGRVLNVRRGATPKRTALTSEKPGNSCGVADSAVCSSPGTGHCLEGSSHRPSGERAAECIGSSHPSRFRWNRSGFGPNHLRARWTLRDQSSNRRRVRCQG